MATPFRSQEVVRVVHDRNRTGLGGYQQIPPGSVIIDKQVLKDYLSEYHHQKPNGRCKADGQVWPCKTYCTIYETVHGQEPWNE